MDHALYGANGMTFGCSDNLVTLNSTVDPVVASPNCNLFWLRDFVLLFQ